MKFFKEGTLIKPGTRADKFLANRYGSSMFSYRQIFAMLGPLILDQFFIYFIGMLTNAMISASSQDSVTAVGLVSPIVMLAMSLIFATSAGGTVIVAQYKGKGDERTMKKSAAQVVMITFLVAAVTATALFIFAEPIMNLTFADAEQIVKDKAISYMRGFFISMLPFAIYNGIFSVLRGIGDTKTCLHLTVIINGIHLFGSVLFVEVLNLDILGTTLSFNIARFVGGAIALYIALSPKGVITFRMSDFFVWNWKLQKAIIKLGVPFAVEQIFLNFGALVAQMYIVKLGTVSIAANTIASSAVNLLYGTGFAVSTLAITVVGQCIGSGDITLAKRYGKRMVEIGTVVMTITTAILYPLMPAILGLYAPQPDALVIIKDLILIGVIPIPFFWSMSYVMPSSLRAAGDANYTSFVCLVCMWVFRVGLGYVLAMNFGMGVYGVWVSMGIEWVARSIFFAIRFKGKKWYLKSVV
ncbi:MAG: MATE family efflux transporter [Oscillospiraceae bacterium]